MGDTITYTCTSPYGPASGSDNGVVTCQAGGTWTTSTLTCAARENILSPYVTNGISNPKYLDESTFINGGIRNVLFSFFISFLFYEIPVCNGCARNDIGMHVSKQNSPKYGRLYRPL